MRASDTDCIQQCLNSQPEAYRQLVGRYQGALLGFLVGRLGDEQRAEEAAQETFVRAFFRLDKLKKPESFFSWLLGIAGRVANEQQRAERRRRAVLGSASRNRPPQNVADDRSLEQAVAALPPSYREIVLMRYYAGLSCGQVAETLGAPLGTITKRLSRAYAMLRESLRRSEHAE